MVVIPPSCGYSDFRLTPDVDSLCFLFLIEEGWVRCSRIGWRSNLTMIKRKKLRTSIQISLDIILASSLYKATHMNAVKIVEVE